MREKPVLVIMAAGMGSRYGGLKQLDPVDQEGDLIVDFSIYDAVEAGFEKVIFIIKREHEKDFRERIGDRLAGHVQVEYVFQELSRLPQGFSVPEGRKKPWGTGHAILCCKDVIHGPFAVINADDYYGKEAFRKLFSYLSEQGEGAVYQYAMAGYQLYNTLTENGHVSRGICRTDGEGRLLDIHERTTIEKHGDKAEFTEDGGKTWEGLPENTIVSMNLWGFTESMLEELEQRFSSFLEKNLPVNPEKCEYFLPFVVDELLKEGKAQVAVLESRDRWYGVTYKEDKPMVQAAIEQMKADGLYPRELWG